MLKKYLSGGILGALLMLSVDLSAQGGPFSAQIQAALRAFTIAAHTWTSPQTIAINNTDSIATDGVVLQNATPSTLATAIQFSPGLRLSGTGFNSSSGLSETDDFLLINAPTTAAGTATGFLTVLFRSNSGMYSNVMSLKGSSGSITYAAGAAYTWSGKTSLNSPADGQMNIVNNANSSGVGFDVGTDSLLKCRNRAQSAYCTVDALAYDASGTPITSGTTHLSAGSGMAVANVGANSCGTSTATIAGNNNAFVITVGTVGGTQCRVAFTITAANEWDCTVTDSTTTIATRATPVDTTHTDFLGAFVAGDKVTGVCFPR